MPVARRIVDKQRRIEHAIEGGGNGARFQIGTDLEPILDKVVMSRERKGQLQVKIGLVGKR